MSKDIDIKPRILIAEGPWGIEEGSLHEIYGGLGAAFGTVMSYDKVYHKCNWTKNWFYKKFTLSDWMMKSEAPFCPHCDELVPSMIQTLWTLKSMDKIQSEATYNKQWASSFIFYPGGIYSVTTPRPGQAIRIDYSKKGKP